MYGFDTANMKRSDEGEHWLTKVLLKSTDDPKVTEDLVISQMRALFANVPDINTESLDPCL